MAETDERDEDIEYWWSGGFPGAFAADRNPPVAPKLHSAFRRVLLAMPAEDFDLFLGLQPTVVCQPAVNGTVYSYYIPVWPKDADAMRLRVIYFRPDLHKLSEDRLVRLVAHEVAHLILGHADLGGAVAGAGDIHAEEATDRKAESWGFMGAYNRAHRRRLMHRHQEAQQKRAKQTGLSVHPSRTQEPA